ncbi:hypothetical protein L7F22_009893 [Adiantum nelumboides]|nr:hypothetical protein [Adiantum nelumboides]
MSSPAQKWTSLLLTSGTRKCLPIIGEGEKGFAVFLLAKELTFLVEILKSFDPFQVRNLVPIAAALREAKNHGYEHVVTGDGLDELLFRDGIAENDVHLGLTKVLSRSAVLLGEALGIKVIQPFLHPKLVRECKAFIHARGLGSGPIELMRAMLKEAFPELSAACSGKAFNEGEVQQQLHAYGILPLSQEERDSEKSHGICGQEGFFISPLEHEDVILEAPWFDRLAVSIKFSERKMSFKFRDKDMYINAQESGSTIPLVNDQAFDKSIKSSVSTYMIFVEDSLNGVNETQVNESGMHEDLKLFNFLNQFQDVFIDDILGELPPKRGEDDHIIELLLGSSPPNKLPYRVSQAQREEIMR